MTFEWDESKNIINYQKHGIYFEEAIEIFKGDCLTWVDGRQECNEVREVTIGQLKKNVVIVIIHTDRLGVVRIISARKANKKERRTYHEYK